MTDEARGVKVIPGAEVETFDLPAIERAGDIQLGHGRIWLGQSVGTVPDGQYKGTQIVVAGRDIAVYVERDEKLVGSIRLDLRRLLANLLTVFEEQEAAQHEGDVGYLDSLARLRDD